MRVRTSSYIIYVKLHNSTKQVIVHGYTGAVDIVSRSVALFLRKARHEFHDVAGIKELDPDTITALMRRGYLTRRLPREEQDYVMRLSSKIETISRKNVSFLFLVAYDCNFRCSYCFENGVSGHGKAWSRKAFSQDMILRAYQTMLEIEPRRDLHSNNITLYGGEPLLAENFDVVQQIVTEGAQRGYSFTAITNGYDLEEFESLIGHGLIESLQITVDGAPGDHDARRVHHKFGPTFDKIVSNINACLRKRVQVNVRVNVDRSNLSSLHSLTSHFEQRSLTSYKNLNLYAALVRGDNDSIKCNAVMAKKSTQISQPVQIDTSRLKVNQVAQKTALNPEPTTTDQFINFEGEEIQLSEIVRNSEDDFTYVESIDRTEFTSEYFQLCKETENLQLISIQDFALKSRIQKSLKKNGFVPFRSDFCGAQTGMFILDPFGDMYTCWELVGMEHHKVGTYGTGLHIIPDQLDLWRGRSISSCPSCSQCKYALYCGGGCAAHALLSGLDHRSPYCDQFPAMFQTVIADMFEGSERNLT